MCMQPDDAGQSWVFNTSGHLNFHTLSSLAYLPYLPCLSASSPLSLDSRLLFPIGPRPTQSALEFCPIHCPNGRLGQDLGFRGIAFALKLPELLNRNLAAVRAKLGQTSCFPNGPQIWCPIGQ